MLVGAGKSVAPIKGAEMWYFFARETIIGFHNRVFRTKRLNLIVPVGSKYGELYKFVVSRLPQQESGVKNAGQYSELDFDAYVGICNKLWNQA